MAAVPAIPDTAADLIDALLRSQIEGLERDLALAESTINQFLGVEQDLALAMARISQLELWLIATGEMDPELGP